MKGGMFGLEEMCDSPRDGSREEQEYKKEGLLQSWIGDFSVEF